MRTRSATDDPISFGIKPRPRPGNKLVSPIESHQAELLQRRLAYKHIPTLIFSQGALPYQNRQFYCCEMPRDQRCCYARSFVEAHHT